MFIVITLMGLMGIAWFLSGKWHVIAPLSFEISRDMDQKRVRVGERVQMTTTMTNRKWLPLPWVNVFTNVPPSFGFSGDAKARLTPDRFSEYNIVTSFLFFERVKRHDTFVPSKRGYYSLEALVVSFGDLFGFSRAERTYPVNASIYVHPIAKPLSRFILTPINLMGDVSVKRMINPDPILAIGSRAYTHDDPFNTIDWKATAKTGQMQVKKMDYTSDPSVMVYLDVQTNETHWNDIDRDAIEAGVELCASLLETATAQKVPFGFGVNSVDPFSRSSTFIKPHMSQKQKVAILDALAMVSPFRGLPMAGLIRKSHAVLDKGTRIVIVTACLTEALNREIIMLHRKGFRIKIIVLKMDDNAKFIPPSGVECVKFEGVKQEVTG